VTESTYTCPLGRREVIDAYFLEHRAKLIDIAAWLDRLDRARPESEVIDFRDAAFRQALGILADGEGHRAKRILDLLSDQTTALPQSAQGMKGASGVPQPGWTTGDAS